jgi:Ca2+-binding EF-hand superfamily protein
MRLIIAIVALGALGFVLYRSGIAEDKPAPPAGTQPGQLDRTKGPHFNAERFVKDHDTNGDGKLSKDELPAGIQDAFAEIDANKDGFITKDELQTHADRMMHRRPQMIEVVYYTIDVTEPETNPTEELQRTYDLLRKLDTNKDGKIDEKELAAFRETRKKERCDAMLKHMDKNGDGKISKDEARGLWADNFAQLDTNKDGFLDKAEVEKALATVVQDRPQPQK